MAVFGGSTPVSSPLHFGGTLPLAPAVAAGGRATVNPPLSLDGRVAIGPPIDAGGLHPLAPAVAAGGRATVNPPLSLDGRVAIGPPIDAGGLHPLAPAVAAGGRATVNPPLSLDGRVAIGPPIDAGGLHPLAPGMAAGGMHPIPPAGNRAAVNPPLSLGGRVVVRGDPQRHFDWVLALLVWIGTWGQEYFQNQTSVKTREPQDLWLQRIHINRSVAWCELQLAWNADNAPDRPVEPHEIAHVQAFVTIMRDICDTNRLKEIYPLNKKGEDVDPPLWDVMLKKYINSHYGPSALMGPHLAHRYPPFIV